MILVTGGCGFIGAALVKALLAGGERVRVLDDLSRGSRKLPGAQYVNGDIRTASVVRTAMRGVDEVIHLAYVNGTKTFYSNPKLVLDVGVQGMLNVLAACNKYGVKRFTLASSSEVCRAQLLMPTEAIPLVIPDPFNPRYSYSAGKIISEMMAIHCGGFQQLLILRPFNIYGPGMSEGHVIPDFIAQLRTLPPSQDHSHVPFKILGSGEETRSFCYIDDFVAGVMLARKGGANREIYNIGTPEETTIAELAHKLAGLMGRKIEVQSGEQLREGDAVRRKPDISKLMKLGYAPKVTLEEGLGRMLQ